MRILIIEDEQKLAVSLKKALEAESYAVDLSFDGQKGYEMAFGEEYDLIILDLGLPNMDGIEIAKNLRKERLKTPILMLTARDTIENKIQGLDSGADDYLVKPFEFDALLARIRTLLKRVEPDKKLFYSVDNLKLDPSSHLVTRNNKEINLSAKEYALLEYLIRRQGYKISV